MTGNTHPMNHTNRYTLQRAEYWQIDKDQNDSLNGVFSNFGDQINIGKAGAFERLIEDVRNHPEGKFPQPNSVPRDLRITTGDSSGLSIPMNGKKTLYIFKLSDASNLIFDPRRFPIEIQLFDEYGYKEYSVLKDIFSDCRYLHFDQDGEIEPKVPNEKQYFNEGYPDTQWACFAFDGKRAAKLKQDLGTRFAFHIHVVDKQTRLSPTHQYELDKGPSHSDHKDSFHLFHPPSWPAHSNDLY